jgi:transposase
MTGHTVAVHTGSVKGVHSNRSETLVPVLIGVFVDQAVSSGDSRLLLWPAVLTVRHICLSWSFRLGARAGHAARRMANTARRGDRPRLRLGRRPGTRFSGRSGAGTAARRARVRPPHRLVRAPIVLVWDRLSTHVSHAIRELIHERAWLTVFLLPACSPDLNPVEWVWAHVKRSLANLAVVALDRLEALVRNRLKRLQYRPDTLDGFIAGTGLALDDPTSP